MRMEHSKCRICGERHRLGPCPSSISTRAKTNAAKIGARERPQAGRGDRPAPPKPRSDLPQPQTDVEARAMARNRAENLPRSAGEVTVSIPPGSVKKKAREVVASARSPKPKPAGSNPDPGAKSQAKEPKVDARKAKGDAARGSSRVSAGRTAQGPAKAKAKAAPAIARKRAPKGSGFDKTAYQRAYMKQRRADERAAREARLGKKKANR